MHLRFTVCGFLQPHERLGIVGSLAELGDWGSPIPLRPIHVAADALHPSCWGIVLNIPENVFLSRQCFTYKYVLWATNEKLSITIIDRDFRFQAVKPDFLPHTVVNPKSGDSLVWEGNGSKDNRQFKFDNEKASKLLHIFDPTTNMVGDEYCLPVAQFGEMATEGDESRRTMRYYLHYKSRQLMHYNRVTERILVGTCPRSVEDLIHLRDKEQVTDVMNFQETCDAQENFLEPDKVPIADRSVEYIAQTCDRLKLKYSWMPVKDMSTEARARCVAQAAFTLAGILTRDASSIVYVHCNAGVGRSVACVTAFWIFCEGVSLRLAELVLSARRPVGYFDEEAMKKGHEDYKRRFGDGYNRLSGVEKENKH